MKRTSFALALALSLLLHLALIVAPGWRLPATELAAPLEAHLAAPAVPAARQIAPKVSRRAPPRSHAPQPRPSVAEPQAAPGVAQPALPAAPIVPVPVQSTEAVPPPEPQPETAPSPEPLLPRHGRIRFAIMRGDQGFVVGQAVHLWKHDGKSYEMNSMTETTGLAALFRPARVTQTSEGEITAEGLKPHEYRTKRNDVATEAATFDWPAEKLRFSGERNAPLSPGSQDMLSLFYQLGQQATQERTEIMLATGKKYERYVFASLGEERLPTRFGEQRVLHLRTVGEVGSEATEVWIGLDAHGLPLKVRYTDRNGESFEQVAEEVEFDDNGSAEGGKLPEKGR